MISPLGSGPEFDRIRAIARALGDRASGLGDDCALIDLGREFLAISCDISIEGVHFRREWLSPEEIGWRAASGALSDLAAMGADPIGVLTSLAVPAESPDSESVAVMEGIGRAIDSVGGKVLGGDLSTSPVWTIDITVLGRTAEPVRRSGALVSDGVWVTGRLGGARAALTALQSKRTAEPYRAAFAHPEARVGAGRWLARHGARAMIDLSDGLAGDASHLAAASLVAIDIDLERLPLGPGVLEVSNRLGVDPYHFAARGGEDYELLVVLPAGFGSEPAHQFERDIGLPLTSIGSVRPGQGVRLLQAGQAVALSGFDHFR